MTRLITVVSVVVALAAVIVLSFWVRASAPLPLGGAYVVLDMSVSATNSISKDTYCQATNSVLSAYRRLPRKVMVTSQYPLEQPVPARMDASFTEVAALLAHKRYEQAFGCAPAQELTEQGFWGLDYGKGTDQASNLLAIAKDCRQGRRYLIASVTDGNFEMQQSQRVVAALEAQAAYPVMFVVFGLSEEVPGGSKLTVRRSFETLFESAGFAPYSGRLANRPQYLLVDPAVWPTEILGPRPEETDHVQPKIAGVH